MGSRLELQGILEELLGTRNVYFQPPASVKMSYPAIVYSLNNIENTFAGNSPYMQGIGYSVTVIDKNPDSEIVKKVSKLPLCSFDRYYAADNLNHSVFTLFY